MRPFLILLCSLWALNVAAQNTCNLSAPLDIADKGKNKLLLASNGNTLLFHFCHGQLFTVSVFDSGRKLIATNAAPVKIMDLNTVEYSNFENAFEINGEALVFFAQTIYGKRSLVRYRFSITTGKMLEETVVLAGERQVVNNLYYVLHLRGQKDYAIYCHRDVFHSPEFKPTLYRYNDKNEVVKKIVFEIPKTKNIEHALRAVSISPDGNVAVAISAFGHETERMASGLLINTSDRQFVFAYCAANDSSFKTTIIDAPQEAKWRSNPTYSTKFLFDDAAHKVYLAFNDNMTYLSDTKLSAFGCLFFTLNTQSMAVTNAWMNYKRLTHRLAISPDSNSAFSHHALYLFAHDTDIMLVSTNKNLQYRTGFQHDLMPRLGITTFSPNGDESMGRELSYSYFADTKDENVITTRDNFTSDYIHPLDYAVSSTGLYLFFNDQSGTYYYKVDNDITCDLFSPFGKQTEGHNRTALNDSSDFDATTGTYATVMLDIANKKATPYIAWCHLM